MRTLLNPQFVTEDAALAGGFAAAFRGLALCFTATAAAAGATFEAS